MTIQDNKKKKSWKQLIFRLLLLVLNIIIIIVLYVLLTDFGANPLIIILVLSFVFLIFLGPLLRGRRKSLYASMFPDKKKVQKEKIQKKEEEIKRREEMRLFKMRHLNKIDLDFEYREPIIRKCDNCGLMIPKFAKKCPICGK